MNEEEIKRLWLQQKVPEVKLKPEMIRELKVEVKIIEGSVKRRDLLEFAAAFFCIPLFIFMAVILPNPASKIGAWLIVGSAVFIIGVLTTFRRHKAVMKSSVVSQLEEDIRFLKMQRRMLRNVAFWYLGPFFFGLVVFHYGWSESQVHFWAMILLTAVIYWYIYLLNRETVKSQFDPIIQKLERVLENLQEN